MPTNDQIIQLAQQVVQEIDHLAMGQPLWRLFSFWGSTKSTLKRRKAMWCFALLPRQRLHLIRGSTLGRASLPPNLQRKHKARIAELER